MSLIYHSTYLLVVLLLGTATATDGWVLVCGAMIGAVEAMGSCNVPGSVSADKSSGTTPASPDICG